MAQVTGKLLSCPANEVQDKNKTGKRLSCQVISQTSTSQVDAKRSVTIQVQTKTDNQAGGLLPCLVSHKGSQIKIERNPFLLKIGS